MGPTFSLSGNGVVWLLLFGEEVVCSLDLVGSNWGRGVGENRAGRVDGVANVALSDSLSLSSLSSRTLESLRGTNVAEVLAIAGLLVPFSMARILVSLLAFLMLWCGVFEDPIIGTLCSDMLRVVPNSPTLLTSAVDISTESVSPAERSLSRW